MPNETVITRRRAVEVYGGVSKLAEALGISRAAIYLWPEDDPIPELQALKLKYELRPDVFGSPTGKVA